MKKYIKEKLFNIKIKKDVIEKGQKINREHLMTASTRYFINNTEIGNFKTSSEIPPPFLYSYIQFRERIIDRIKEIQQINIEHYCKNYFFTLYWFLFAFWHSVLQKEPKVNIYFKPVRS